MNDVPALAGDPSAESLRRCVYECLAGWNPGLPTELRKMILLMGVLYALLALGLALLFRRPRLRVLSIVILSMLVIGGIEWWRRTHPPIVQIQGTIQITDNTST